MRRDRASVCTVVAVAVAAAGCADEREGPVATDLTTWVDDVAPAIAGRCTGCHTGATPAGGYDLGSYLGALGSGSDGVANAIAGDAGSKIVVMVSTDAMHAPVADLAPVIRAWVVDSRLAYRDSLIHAPGLLNPADPEFHGAELRRRGWDFATCQRCHGDDFAGGTSGAPCTTCHVQGPTACDTCHAAVPDTGAHRAHVASATLDRPVECSECHRVPARWDDPGHILDASGAVDPAPAEVVLGALANRDVSPPRRTVPASYDPATRTCTGVYCHGGILGDPAAAHATPGWNDGAGAATCGSCHGAPPANHAQSECAMCHPTTVDAGGALAAAHLDGAIESGDGSGTCTACHGADGNPAPPRGLHGELATSALAVGAHRVHLSPSGLTGAIACSECHVVPVTVGAPGHIDTPLPAEVFAPGAGVLARADGATPTWDRATATCTGVYCHGAGTALAGDPSPGVRAPVWTAGEQVYCGSCHGVPPDDAAHTPAMTITDCATCHSDIDAFGNIIVTGSPPTSRHINGVVDAP